MDSGTIDGIWSKIYGLPAWSVKKGYGSFLTFEFGEPILQIREPVTASSEASDEVRASLGRRRVYITGAWHLWIYCCNWSIALQASSVAHNESSDETIEFATNGLDGQQIISVSRGKTKGSWVFTFDLGGELTTWPYGEDPSDEQWLLYERASGRVVIVRADDHFSYPGGRELPQNYIWHPI